MSSAQAGHHPGWTSEAVWRGFFSDFVPPRLDLLSRDGHARRVLVASAHPDDDILAISGLLNALKTAGAHLSLVVATDGEASHPSGVTPEGTPLAKARRLEYRNALAELGINADRVVFLGLPDSGLADTRDQLEASLKRLTGAHDTLVAPWRCDGHPDHEAVGNAMFATKSDDSQLWEYPVWGWHWANPATEVINWQSARAHRLSSRAQVAKAAAIEQFRTQLDAWDGVPPILPKPFVEHFARDHEIVFTS